jgi:ABC-2 type transport system ATP-binding protein
MTRETSVCYTLREALTRHMADASGMFNVPRNLESKENMHMDTFVLRVRDLEKSFGRHKVLRGVSFEVAPGTLVGIVGENGAGKSTLLKILAGELRPNSGQIVRRGAQGYCPQQVVVHDGLTVNQHLDYFRAAYGLRDLHRAEELLEHLGYAAYRTSLVKTLSGGTKQKLNLTLALMHRPQVLLLDEPYQGFDWETYLRFWDLTSELRAQGCALLVISHLFFEQHRFDALYQLRQGRLTRVPATEPTGGAK